MPYVTPTLVTTGDLYTAAQHNTDVLGNIIFLASLLMPTEVSQVSATNVTVNFATSPLQRITRVGATTVLLQFPRPGTYILKLVHDGTNNTYAFGFNVASPVKWDHGIAPAVSNGANNVDLITFYWDGATAYGGYQTTMV